eukprot:CAMPEP_0197881996 /NCGR_PEP_ID=MMETSP1439-20131203/9293_1 /TAXON_ID=66791 /ORGANISM="Gonyaulax spinifera, Strain CCMP409" /LENGTH=421 /DNA_ID=CAMNT_0043501633 /DNA_START=70 /DNA_END=1333 /DNA_ORIENTATION=-
MRCLTVAAAAAGVALVAGTMRLEGLRRLSYRIRQGCQAFASLYSIPAEELDAFVHSFQVFERNTSTFYVDSEEDYQQVKNYYRVLNRLCTLGSVEKMYIPPLVDPSVGVFENQLLFERSFADELRLEPGKAALEIGCGRGRISHHIASRTGASVVGINIDPAQLAVARQYANETGLLQRGQLQFLEANMNDPLPFQNASFDAFYQVQAMTYAKDLRAVFREVARVLKPGAKLSILDGVMLDGYNASDASHRQLLNETRQVTGFGGLWHADEWRVALEDSGFRVLFHGDRSLGGHQTPLIEQELRLFDVWTVVVKVLTALRVLPHHFALLMERFNRHKESFVEMDRRGMLTTSWQLLAKGSEEAEGPCRQRFHKVPGASLIQEMLGAAVMGVFAMLSLPRPNARIQGHLIESGPQLGGLDLT